MHDPEEDVAVTVDLAEPESALTNALDAKELTSFHILFTTAMGAHGFVAGVVRGPEDVVRELLDHWGYGEKDTGIRYRRDKVRSYVEGAGWCFNLIPEENDDPSK